MYVESESFELMQKDERNDSKGREEKQAATAMGKRKHCIKFKNVNPPSLARKIIDKKIDSHWRIY